MALKFFSNDEQVWADMEVAIAGAVIGKIRGINYSIESEDEELFVAGDEAISIQSGNIKKSGSIKVLKEALDNMHAAAVLKGGRSVLDLRFDIVISYMPVIGGTLTIDTLGRCKINKMPKGWEQGATHMEHELTFKFLDYKGV